MIGVEFLEWVIFTSAEKGTSDQVVKDNEEPVGQMFCLSKLLEEINQFVLFIHNLNKGILIVIIEEELFTHSSIKILIRYILVHLINLLILDPRSIYKPLLLLLLAFLVLHLPNERIQLFVLGKKFLRLYP